MIERWPSPPSCSSASIRLTRPSSPTPTRPWPTLREATPIFFNERTGQWVITRFADVHETLRDRRLGRVYTHRYTHAEFGRPEPDPRWAAFDEHERWSLLQLEPPDHTRIRRLIAKVFTPTAVSGPAAGGHRAGRGAARRMRRAGPLRPPGRLRPAVLGRRDLLAARASRAADTRLLLDWSHAIVKMYELTTTDEQRAAATVAAQEFMDYTTALIAAKRADPDGLWSPSWRRWRTRATV